MSFGRFLMDTRQTTVLTPAGGFLFLLDREREKSALTSSQIWGHKSSALSERLVHVHPTSQGGCFHRSHSRSGLSHISCLGLLCRRNWDWVHPAGSLASINYLWNDAPPASPPPASLTAPSDGSAPTTVVSAPAGAREVGDSAADDAAGEHPATYPLPMSLTSPC